jgi:dihydroorotate dehydrogenase (NAD+) catalytic subunit
MPGPDCPRRWSGYSLPMPVDLSLNLAGVTLRNPIIAASGTAGYVDEIADAIDPTDLGALVTKSITREERRGNDTPRIVDTPCGMLNAIGLANVGLERFMAEKAPRIAHAGTSIIGSIAGGSIDDYVTVAQAFDAIEQMPMVEVNVSCPNTRDGLVFGEDPARLGELLREVRSALAQTKMIVKISPNVSDVRPLASAAIETGADALTLINTIAGLAIDVRTRRPRLSTGAGGYSGPAIHPIAVRMVHQVHRDVAAPANIPLIGSGGVMNWRNAAEMILAGASAVAMGTALFADPGAPRRVVRDLARWAKHQGCERIADLVGKAILP